MKIVYVKNGPVEESVCLCISTEGGNKKYIISHSEYAACNSPVKNEEIDGATFERIEGFDEYHKAYKKALSILSYGDNNRKNLSKKLRLAGFSYAASQEAIRAMINLGYVDEHDQLRRYILSEANVKLRGPNLIIGKLMSKGYDVADIRAVMEELVEEGEIIFKKNAMLLIEKKLPEDATAAEKKTLLYKNGYKM